MSWARLLAAVALLAAMPEYGRADLMLTFIPSAQMVSPGASGSFDIRVTNMSASAVLISAFSLGILNDNPTLFPLVDMDFPDTGYLFEGNSAAQGAGDPLAPFPSAGEVVGADFPETTDTVPLAAGASALLATVTFSVDPAAPSSATAQLTIDASVTAFFDETLLGEIALGPSGFGTINVAPVPEPGSLALLGLTAAGGALAAWRRRRGCSNAAN